MFKLKAIALAVSGLSLVSGCAMMRGPDKSASVKPAASSRNNSANAEAIYRTGRDFQAQGRYDLAVEAYRKVLAANPNHVEAHNALGVVYSTQGLTQQAEQEFKTAIALAPKLAHLHNNLGYLYLQRGRTRDATAEFEQARKLNPTNVHAQNNLALAAQKAAQDNVAAPPAPVAMPAPVFLPESTPLVVPVSAPVAVAQPDPVAPAEAAKPTMPTPTVNMISIGSNVWEIRPRATTPPAADEVTRLVAVSPASMFGPSQQNGVVAPDNRPLRLEISNGNGTSGLATNIAAYLREQGYPRARLTNRLPYDQTQTEIQYLAGYESAARELGATFAVSVKLVAMPQIDRQMQVRVVLGKDLGGAQVAAKARKPAASVAATPVPPKSPAENITPVDYRRPVPAKTGYLDFLKSFF